MRTRLWLGCVLGPLSSCGFDVPRPGYVTQTQIAAVRQTVELGPLSPSRVGPLFAYDDEIPIAHTLPGDRVILEAIVIDVDGVQLEDDEVETLWVQCGAGPCEDSYEGFVSAEFDVPCVDLSSSSVYTTDSNCVLGTGSARFEFMAPDPGYGLFEIDSPLGPRLSLFGVVAWNGRSAADCWARLRGDRAELDGCEFIEQNVTYGPDWALWEYVAGMMGWPPVDPDPISDLLKLPANRIPRAPELTIVVDGEVVAAGRPPLEIIAVRPGAAIDIALTFDVTSQLFQGRFVWEAEDTYRFEPEGIDSRTLTTNAIRRVGPDRVLQGDATFQYRVDASAPPGVSRVLIGWRDTRRGNDILTVEFEVE